MKHIWTVLCEKSTIDKDSNNISLYNIIEKINISGPIEELTKLTSSKDGEVFAHNLSLVSLWSREKKEKGDITFTFKVDLESPEKNNLMSNKREVSLKERYKRTRTKLEMNGTKITGPGEYIFKVSKKEGKNYKVCAETPLEISFQKKH